MRAIWIFFTILLFGQSTSASKDKAEHEKFLKFVMPNGVPMYAHVWVGKSIKSHPCSEDMEEPPDIKIPKSVVSILGVIFPDLAEGNLRGGHRRIKRLFVGPLSRPPLRLFLRKSKKSVRRLLKSELERVLKFVTPNGVSIYAHVWVGEGIESHSCSFDLKEPPFQIKIPKSMVNILGVIFPELAKGKLLRLQRMYSRSPPRRFVKKGDMNIRGSRSQPPRRGAVKLINKREMRSKKLKLRGSGRGRKQLKKREINRIKIKLVNSRNGTQRKDASKPITVRLKNGHPRSRRSLKVRKMSSTTMKKNRRKAAMKLSEGHSRRNLSISLCLGKSCSEGGSGGGGGKKPSGGGGGDEKKPDERRKKEKPGVLHVGIVDVKGKFPDVRRQLMAVNSANVGVTLCVGKGCTGGQARGRGPTKSIKPKFAGRTTAPIHTVIIDDKSGRLSNMLQLLKYKRNINFGINFCLGPVCSSKPGKKPGGGGATTKKPPAGGDAGGGGGGGDDAGGGGGGDEGGGE